MIDRSLLSQRVPFQPPTEPEVPSDDGTLFVSDDDNQTERQLERRNENAAESSSAASPKSESSLEQSFVELSRQDTGNEPTAEQQDGASQSLSQQKQFKPPESTKPFSFFSPVKSIGVTGFPGAAPNPFAALSSPSASSVTPQTTQSNVFSTKPGATEFPGAAPNPFAISSSPTASSVTPQTTQSSVFSTKPAAQPPPFSFSRPTPFPTNQAKNEATTTAPISTPAFKFPPPVTSQAPATTIPSNPFSSAVKPPRTESIFNLLGPFGPPSSSETSVPEKAEDQKSTAKDKPANVFQSPKIDKPSPTGEKGTSIS